MTGRDVPALHALVRRARRRMRLNRALAVAARTLVLGGVAALLWACLSRAVVLPDADGWLGLGLAGAGALVVAVAAAVRIPPVWAAWAADLWLDSRDRFSTAVELAAGGELRGLAARQVALAEQAAAGVRAFPAGPRVPARSLAIGAAVVLLSVALGLLPNPQDAVRAQRAAEREALAAQAGALRAAASQLAGPDATPVQRDLAEELERVAAQLDQAPLEAGLERLADARADLTSRVDPGRAAQRTALAGLARELAVAPLAPGESVQEQLETLATQLDQGSARADQALAGRLSQLESALSAGSPEVAAALGRAAAAAVEGDAAGAARALREASSAVGEASARLEEQDAVAAADAVLADAQAGLRAAQGQGEGRGPSPAQGRGAGPGGGGGGNPTGADDGGARQGRGQTLGSQQQGIGTDDQLASDLDLQTVYDPPQRIGGDGEDLRLGGDPDGPGPSTDLGRRQGEGLRTTPLVPYLDVLAEYAERAARTVERPGYPDRLRGTVQDYFDRLGAAQG